MPLLRTTRLNPTRVSSLIKATTPSRAFADIPQKPTPTSPPAQSSTARNLALASTIAGLSFFGAYWMRREEQKKEGQFGVAPGARSGGGV